jgi:hypothetical protein
VDLERHHLDTTTPGKPAIAAARDPHSPITAATNRRAHHDQARRKPARTQPCWTPWPGWNPATLGQVPTRLLAQLYQAMDLQLLYNKEDDQVSPDGAGLTSAAPKVSFDRAI